MRHTLLGVLMFAAVPVVYASEGSPSPADVRLAVERSLPYLEKEGLAWIKERKCVSCHVVPYMLWSYNEAQSHGAAVDAKKLNEWTTWSLNYSLSKRQWYKLADATTKQLQADGLPALTLGKLKPLASRSFVTEQELLAEAGKMLTPEELNQHRAALLKRALQPKAGEKNDGGGMATLGPLLVGRGHGKSELMDAFLAAAPAVMVKWQEPNGSWKAGGQLPRQNRSTTESDEITTSWALLGLVSLPKSDAAAAKSIAAGLAYLKKSKPGKSNERLLVQMLIERTFGKAADADKALKEVLSRQNADGGWSWITGKASDGFATGQTLYALSVAGLKTDDDAIRRAQKYLLDTQNKEGYWAVPPQAVTDPASNEGRIKRLIPIYHFWGTAWATIGLSRSLPPKQ